MKTNLILSLSMTLILMLTSCSSLYIANSNIEPIVFVKPVYRDSAIVSSYIGGKFNKSIFPNPFNDLTDSYLGQISLSQTKTEELYSLSYGLFGHFGKIDLNEWYSSQSVSKSYFGGGISSEFQLTIPYENLVLRPIGIRGSLVFEDGDFFKYKQKNIDNILSLPDKYAVNMSGTAGMDFIIKQNSIGINASCGYITSFPSYFTDLAYTANIYYTTPKFMIFFQKSGTLITGSDDYVKGLNIRLKNK